MHRTLRLASVDSTNAEAMRRAAAGETGPLWIVADTQIGGTRPIGRHWSSAPGNLHASLLGPPLDACAQGLSALARRRRRRDRRRSQGTMSLPAEAPPAPQMAERHSRRMPRRRRHPGREQHRAPTGLVAVIGIGINLAAHPDDPGAPGDASRRARHRARSRNICSRRLAQSLAALARSLGRGRRLPRRQRGLACAVWCL